jgi:hypothetical protein
MIMLKLLLNLQAFWKGMRSNKPTQGRSQFHLLNSTHSLSNLQLHHLWLVWFWVLNPSVIVNIWCHDDLDICREFHEFKLQETAQNGKKQNMGQVYKAKSFSESFKVRTTVGFRSTNKQSLLASFNSDSLFFLLLLLLDASGCIQVYCQTWWKINRNKMEF